MIPCPFCSQNAVPVFRTKDYNRRISQDTFEHYRCLQCNVIFLSPVPKDLGKYYPEAYYAVPESRQKLEESFQKENYKIDILRRFAEGGRLLEIGPASGGFAYLAKKAGFEVKAIEMDAKCCQFLNDVVGVKAINSSNVLATLDGLSTYNVIALWHVIEHLPDPARILEKISQKLAPGGILILATPNPDAFQFHMMGKFWPHVDAPRHLTLIPSQVMIKKMAAFGFKPVLSTTADKGSIINNGFGWRQFFANMCSFPLVSLALRVIGLIVSVIVYPIERIEGKGSSYTLVFRKER